MNTYDRGHARSRALDSHAEFIPTDRRYRSFLPPLSAKPFIKWVGSKRSIVGALLARLPASYTEYHEPFVGGGALFFAAQPRSGHISDVNLHLVLA